MYLSEEITLFAHKSTCKCSPGVLTSTWHLNCLIILWQLGIPSSWAGVLFKLCFSLSQRPVQVSGRGFFGHQGEERGNHPAGVDVPRLQLRGCRWQSPKQELGPLREGLQSTFLAPAGEGKGLCKPGGGVEQRPGAAPG